MAEEHRVILDPTVIERLATSMDHIAQAWRSDVEALVASKSEVGDRDRTINRLAANPVDNVRVNLGLSTAAAGSAKLFMPRVQWRRGPAHRVRRHLRD